MLHVLAATQPEGPSGGGSTPANIDPDQVTPGTIGFIATFLLAVAVFFLIRDMTKRIRRVRYREQVQDEMRRDADGDPGGGYRPVPGGKRGGKYGPDAPDPFTESETGSGHDAGDDRDDKHDDDQPPESGRSQ